MDTTRWSHTRIDTYLRCPEAYRLKYVEGEPQIPTEGMVRGQQYHEAIQRYATHCYRLGKRPVKSDFDKARFIAASYPDLEEEITRVLENILWDWGSMLPGDTGPVEVLYEAPLPNGDSFCGVIDLLQRYEGGAADDPFSDADNDTLWAIIDWKSGFYQYRDEQPPMQLLGYAWLVQQRWPDAKNFALSIQSLSGRSPDPWRLSGDMGWVADRILSCVERIYADKDLRPNMGPHCATCVMAASCKHAGTAAMGALREDPAAISESVFAADAVRTLGKKTIKALVSSTGVPLEAGDGKVWSWREREVLKPRTVQDFVFACGDAGIEPWQYLVITPAQFAKAVADAPEPAKEILLSVARTCIERDFGIHAASEGRLEEDE
ncbi:MAG TPA: PD-(D/E)XK nuclease family protein [Candidatus Cryosericum sp.]|nr:PD-(D/E)XK nuclease family protein [Candidatus Cryosericum sp.]